MEDTQVLGDVSVESLPLLPIHCDSCPQAISCQAELCSSTYVGVSAGATTGTPQAGYELSSKRCVATVGTPEVLAGTLPLDSLYPPCSDHHTSESSGICYRKAIPDYERYPTLVPPSPPETKPLPDRFPRFVSRDYFKNSSPRARIVYTPRHSRSQHGSSVTIQPPPRRSPVASEAVVFSINNPVNPIYQNTLSAVESNSVCAEKSVVLWDRIEQMSQVVSLLQSEISSALKALNELAEEFHCLDNCCADCDCAEEYVAASSKTEIPPLATSTSSSVASPSFASSSSSFPHTIHSATPLTVSLIGLPFCEDPVQTSSALELPSEPLIESVEWPSHVPRLSSTTESQKAQAISDLMRPSLISMLNARRKSES